MMITNFRFKVLKKSLCKNSKIVINDPVETQTNQIMIEWTENDDHVIFNLTYPFRCFLAFEGINERDPKLFHRTICGGKFTDQFQGHYSFYPLELYYRYSTFYINICDHSSICSCKEVLKNGEKTDLKLSIDMTTTLRTVMEFNIDNEMMMSMMKVMTKLNAEDYKPGDSFLKICDIRDFIMTLLRIRMPVGRGDEFIVLGQKIRGTGELVSVDMQKIISLIDKLSIDKLMEIDEWINQI